MRRITLALGLIALGVLRPEPALAQPTPAAGGPLPEPWMYRDIGAVGLTGNASFDAESRFFRIESAGSDIWGESDSFGYAYVPCLDDCEIIAVVREMGNTHPFAKAGVMVRETLEADSAHAILDLLPDGGVEFLARPATGAATQFVAGSFHSIPVTLRLFRDGPVLRSYVREADGRETPVGTATVPMGSTIFVGLAVTSHDAGQLNTSIFNPFSVRMTGVHPLPLDWYATDVGDTGTAGSEEYDAGTYTVRGAGADIWDTGDAFRYVSQSAFAGNVQIVTRVANVENTDPFAKAGLMARQTGNPDPSAANVLLDIRPTGDIEFMARSSRGEVMTFIAGASHALPVWLKLDRTGSSVTGSISSDGRSWIVLGTATIESTAWFDVGLAVTSHQRGVLNTSTFDSVAISNGRPGELPRRWQHGDIGETGQPGDASYEAGVFTARGAGDDIGGTSDTFHFLLESLDADTRDLYTLEHVQLVARIVSMENTHPAAKAGLMIRGLGYIGAPHVTLALSPTGDIELISRPATGEPTVFIAGATAAAPVWLKLVRYHSTFTGYMSSDGASWTIIGTAENTLGATGTWHDVVSVGLAVTSHDSTVLNTSTFDQVDVRSPRLRYLGESRY